MEMAPISRLRMAGRRVRELAGHVFSALSWRDDGENISLKPMATS